ncbi:tetratricopeptide repeat protein [Kaistella sp. PBT33-4]|uniref:tetratricopeptide repeat protein n=1 Tax=Kaistella sp. PBT33-4 TaxID=3032000 RepID=UPI0023D86916|nr:tetratricopeptide repeat protein [Kaistella sp. PBT33-4]MDF0720957.1 tetratricopeptide repeat protein [Kaistella sp. PBT33-4]
MSKKYYLFILLALSSNFLFSQTIPSFLTNEWIKVKVQMLDGSKDVSETYSSSKFYRLSFSEKEMCMDYQPINSNGKTCSKYNLESNFIRTSPESGYEIVKLSSDSLIIIERINGVNENDKIRKLWFKKSSLIKKEYSKKFDNDSIIIASENFTPTINKNLILDIAENFRKKNRYPKFNLIGNIVFFPKSESLTIEVLNEKDKSVIDNQENIDFIKSIFQNSYKYWNLNGFEKFKKISIPFIINSDSYGIDESYTYKGTPIFYFMNDTKDIEKYYGIKMQDLRDSEASFRRGISLFENEKYDKAIEHFLKSYEVDNRKIDALYNIVSLYNLKSDQKNMCLYLKKLKDLEQTLATNLYNEKCPKL